MKHSILIYSIVFVLVCDVAFSKRPEREDERNMRKERRNRRKEERNRSKEERNRSKEERMRIRKERNNCQGRFDEFLEKFMAKYEEDRLPDCFDQVEEYRQTYLLEGLSREEIKERMDEIQNEWEEINRREKRPILNCLKDIKSNIKKDMEYKPSGRCIHSEQFSNLFGNYKYFPLLIIHMNYGNKDNQGPKESKPSGEGTSFEESDKSDKGNSSEKIPNEEDRIPIEPSEGTPDDQPQEPFDEGTEGMPNEEERIPIEPDEGTSDDEPEETFDDGTEEIPNEEERFPMEPNEGTSYDQPEESFDKTEESYYQTDYDYAQNPTSGTEYYYDYTTQEPDEKYVTITEESYYTYYQTDYDYAQNPTSGTEYYYDYTQEPDEKYVPITEEK